MKKGFSLIELVVVIALVGILLSVASLSSKNVLEKRALEEAKTKISTVLKLAGERSFNDGEVYTITLDYNSKTITVEDADSNIEEVIELPDMLEYTTVTKIDGTPTKEDVKVVTTTASGGMTSFSVYIFDTKEEVEYRVSVDYVNNPSGLAYVNTYKNISAGINYNNVEVKHYNFNYNQWEKE